MVFGLEIQSMTLTKIVMHLARNPEAGFAEGSREHGYLLVLPLTADGQIDEDLWHARRSDCSVRAFSPDAPVREGRLARRGHNWYFDYDRGGVDDDEPVFKLEQHRFEVGEYVTIRDHDETPLVYRIDGKEPLD